MSDGFVVFVESVGAAILKAGPDGAYFRYGSMSDVADARRVASFLNNRDETRRLLIAYMKHGSC